jgi:hypothetical protein
MNTSAVSYKNHRFPPQIIARAVWLYYRFPLSLRLVQERLLDRGDDAGDDQDEHDVRTLLDDVDETRIEIEPEPLGDRHVYHARIADERPRLRDHPGDRRTPRDGRGNANPEREARRQRERGEANEDQR